MPCYSPLTGYRSLERNPATGKRKIVFKAKDGMPTRVTLPCGQCIGCRLERSRQWAIRCVHEASLYDENCFITLTYNNENLPKNGTLEVEAYQKFMKRLRKEHGEGIRFFQCGEYGEKFSRPHYHACLFNFDFKDKELWSIRDGNRLYVSKNLQELWPYGFSSIGDVTFESAAYVARYITKKVTGEKAVEHYNRIDKQTGEIVVERHPEYITMSRRPGIGKPWLDKFQTDVYPDDFVVLGGKKMRPPKYYDNRFEVDDPETFSKIKEQRKRQVKESAPNATWERLAVREELQYAKAGKLLRGYEK